MEGSCTVPVAARLKVALVCCVALLCGACGGAGGSATDAGTGGGSGGGGASPPPISNQNPRRHDGFEGATVKSGFDLDIDVTFGGRAFHDPDGDTLTYRVWFLGSADPSSFNGMRVSGTHLVGVADNRNIYDIVVRVEDGRGGLADFRFWLTVNENRPPVLVRPNEDQVLALGATVDVDAAGGGAVFTDPDGDPLTYRIEFLPRTLGLRSEGSRISGTLDDYGAAFVRVFADDGFDGIATDEFAIAAPAVESRRPALPAIAYVYADEDLPLPFVARQSRQHFATLWDTTPSYNPTTNAGAALGRVLFYDRRLSIHNLGSCGTCHQQAHGFASPEPFSAGPQGELTRRNVMGLTDVRYNFDGMYFTDQRVFSLERLVPIPIEDRTELGNSMKLLVPKLQAVDFYPPLFEAAFGTPEVTEERIAHALAQFLRSLIAFNSKFDRAYHPMDEAGVPVPEEVLTSLELRGAEIFNGRGNCFRCHAQGAQTMDSPGDNGLDPAPANPSAPLVVFRTASLRNVAATAPYMRDGRFATLRDVIEHYSSGVIDKPTIDPRMRGLFMGNPVNLNLSEQDKDALEAFLNTLTDESFLTDPRFSDPFARN
ncbi:MAG TPA: cytochrome c peroxidase [Steroidobacteraceae bacterium]|nr:cytochrome c peroxidase [Steroidobacteraceae bacterium]